MCELDRDEPSRTTCRKDAATRATVRVRPVALAKDTTS